MERGAAEYRRYGTQQSPGPKLFCVSGDVLRPGVYEVPFGVTLRHLLEDLAGGLHSGRSLQAVLFGGAAGAFATPEDLDVRLSFEDLRLAGLPLGSGVVMVFDDRRDQRRFTSAPLTSRGKCYPCQMGTSASLKFWLACRRSDSGDAKLMDVGWTMTDARCADSPDRRSAVPSGETVAELSID
jgi:NADH-quinone oxidoreductase subunit F